MDKTDILIFDVGLGQSIYIYPHSHPTCGTLVDCGNIEGFEPIDYLLNKGYVSNNTLEHLVITNYDQDHFSGLPYLRKKVNIKAVTLSKNLSSAEIRNLKTTSTEALDNLCIVKDTYTKPYTSYNPPYKTEFFHLEKSDLDNVDTNNLSQVVFLEHYGSVICISGDLEEVGWKTLLEKKPTIKEWLRKTHVFIASHHGRVNGYYPEIFEYCKPECIIISDKGIIHDTQRNMSSLYGTHISGEGISFNASKRKVLTTRDDGHIYIQLHDPNIRVYNNFKH